MSDHDQIHNTLLEIKKSVGGIEQHLSDLNSNVQKNQNKIEENSRRITNLEGKINGHGDENRYWFESIPVLTNLRPGIRESIIGLLVAVLLYFSIRYLELKVGLQKLIESLV